MFAEIVSIGDELLIGQVINTNSAWIAEELNKSGVQVKQVTTISDSKDHILDSLKDASKRAGIIIITGGLGPTKDDITKQTLCEYFNTSLKFNESVAQNIERLFGHRGLTWNELNKQQAYVPENCTVLQNDHGTAPGMYFEQGKVLYFSLPGVPFEMRPLITDQVIPEILKRLSPGAIVHKTVYTQGIPESELASRIESWENELPEYIKLAYLPKPGMVRLRLSATGNSKEDLTAAITNEVDKLTTLMPGEIFGGDEKTLEEVIGSGLRKMNKTVSTAESCTGGYIAHLITSVAGSSDYFQGSVVAYSNDIKENILGVRKQYLIDFGAVSGEVVKAMAEGVMKKFRTDFAIATSGVAGPGGGTEDKPVGTTWIALSTKDKTITKKFQFGNERERNIKRTALTALNMLRKELQVQNAKK